MEVVAMVELRTNQIEHVSIFPKTAAAAAKVALKDIEHAVGARRLLRECVGGMESPMSSIADSKVWALTKPPLVQFSHERAASAALGPHVSHWLRQQKERRGFKSTSERLQSLPSLGSPEIRMREIKIIMLQY
jgi:hypothetical protein